MRGSPSRSIDRGFSMLVPFLARKPKEQMFGRTFLDPTQGWRRQTEGGMSLNEGCRVKD